MLCDRKPLLSPALNELKQPFALVLKLYSPERNEKSSYGRARNGFGGATANANPVSRGNGSQLAKPTIFDNPSAFLSSAAPPALPFDANFGNSTHPGKGVQMGFQIRRLTPVQTREFRVLRIDRKAVQPRAPAKAPAPTSLPDTAQGPDTPRLAGNFSPAAKSPQDDAPTNLRIQTPPAEDHSPAARARKAKRRLRRLFERARRNAKGRARLCRTDEYELLP